MAVAVRNFATQTGAGTFSLVIPVTSSVAGDFLAVGVGYNDATAIVTVTDNLGQTWTSFATNNNGVAQDAYIFCRPNTLAGVTSVTVGFDVGVNASAVYAAFSGVADNAIGDPDNSGVFGLGNTGGTGVTSLTITAGLPMSVANELLIAFWNVDPKTTETFTPTAPLVSVASVTTQIATQVVLAWVEYTTISTPSVTMGWSSVSFAPGELGIGCLIEVAPPRPPVYERGVV